MIRFISRKRSQRPASIDAKEAMTSEGKGRDKCSVKQNLTVDSKALYIKHIIRIYIIILYYNDISELNG